MNHTRNTAATVLLFTGLALLLGDVALGQSDGAVQAGPGGFALSSGDADWRLRLRGLVQLDGRAFADDAAPDADSEWLLRRVRPSLEGEFGDRVSFRIMPDFAGGSAALVDAYVDTKVGGGLQLRVGKFKSPVGLERLQSANDLRLVERSIVTDLLPNRDLGVQLSSAGRLTWAIGLFNGVADGRSGDEDDDGNQEVAGRLFVHAFDSDDMQLGVGVGASYGKTDGQPLIPLLSSYRSPGQNAVFLYRVGADGTFADGERTRVSPQFYWYGGSLGLLGEWATVSQDVRRTGPSFDRSEQMRHHAWQLTGEWFVTGEAAGYRDSAEVGAVQLVARFSTLDIDDAAFTGGEASFANPALAARAADTWGIGVNWFPLAGIKASLSWQQTSFDGGSPSGDRRDEKVLFLRSQLRF